MKSLIKMELTPERQHKFEKAAARSQTDITVVLENVHDPHNIGAVLRSCDSVGIREVYVLYNEHSQNALKQYVGIHSAAGALKWVNVHFFTNTNLCMEMVKTRYAVVAGTHLNTESKSVYDIDFSGSVALVFGNEKSGLSQDILPYLDFNFIIPQHGLVQSLNISVACAISLFEMSRQRTLSGCYSKEYSPADNEMKKVYDHFVRNHMESLKNKNAL